MLKHLSLSGCLVKEQPRTKFLSFVDQRCSLKATHNFFNFQPRLISSRFEKEDRNRGEGE